MKAMYSVILSGIGGGLFASGIWSFFLFHNLIITITSCIIGDLIIFLGCYLVSEIIYKKERWWM